MCETRPFRLDIASFSALVLRVKCFFQAVQKKRPTKTKSKVWYMPKYHSEDGDNSNRRRDTYKRRGDKYKRRAKRQAATREMCRGTLFIPSNWNYDPVQRRNNCYNYACNTITNTFAQPGKWGGQRHSRMEASNVYRACLRDGLVPIRATSRYRVPRPRGYCLIALFIWPGEDFHFVRRDFNGYWSQKNGKGRARNYDNALRPMRDPRFSMMGPYQVFAGFLGVHPGVRIR